jgi:hypothetical protein
LSKIYGQSCERPFGRSSALPPLPLAFFPTSCPAIL